MKKEFFEALLNAINKTHSMRGLNSEWIRVGNFTFDGRMYAFIIEGTKGTWRCVESDNYANEWFDVSRQFVGSKTEYQFIVFMGKKYSPQKTLF